MSLRARFRFPFSPSIEKYVKHRDITRCCRHRCCCWGLWAFVFWFCRFLTSTSTLTFLCVLFSLYRTLYLLRVLILLHTNFSTSAIAIFSIARSSQCHIAWIIRNSFLSFPCISVHSILPKWNILFNNIELAMIIIIGNLWYSDKYSCLLSSALFTRSMKSITFFSL